jgi:hypothetical protein
VNSSTKSSLFFPSFDVIFSKSAKTVELPLDFNPLENYPITAKLDYNEF